jgi:hypothetical protein
VEILEQGPATKASFKKKASYAKKQRIQARLRAADMKGVGKKSTGQ